jgi:hypothetical protein
MNPTMLEASDDLTNLSHLNEPAGKPKLLPAWWLLGKQHADSPRAG